eukprot:Selendium_serpulae@DN9280_c0_g1_i1.p1
MLDCREGRIARWVSRLSEYTFSVACVPRKELEDVDYLNKFVDYDEDFDFADRMHCCATFVPAASPAFPTLEEVFEGKERKCNRQEKDSRRGVAFYCFTASCGSQGTYERQ